MQRSRLPRPSISPFVFIFAFVSICLYLPLYSSEDLDGVPSERTTDGIGARASPSHALSVVTSERHSTLSPAAPASPALPASAKENASSTQQFQLRGDSSQSGAPSSVRPKKNRRSRRHASSIPTPADAERDKDKDSNNDDDDEEEVRVPYGPIWTGSREALNCPGCDYNEMMRRNRIESIKEDLLRKLKMVAPPNITAPRYFSNFKNLLLHHSRDGSVEAPDDPDMQNDAPYAPDLEGSYEDGDKSTAMRVFNFCQGEVHYNQSTFDNLEFACSFSFQSHILSMEAANASIGVYVERLGSPTHKHTADSFTSTARPHRNLHAPTVYLYRILPDGGSEVFGKRRVHFGPSSNGAWVEIDARHVVRSWLSDPSSNRGIKVRLETHRRDHGSYRIVSPHSIERDEDVDHRPFVDIALRNGPRSPRARRSTPSDICEEVLEDRECCRYPLIINFTEYRWDFIVHPKTYNAYYCAGICTTALRLVNPHSHVAQQSNPENSLCCSPKLYAPLLLLYTDSESRVLTESLPSMIAERCGCS